MKSLIIISIGVLFLCGTDKAQTVGWLKIRVLEGEGALNNIRNRVGRDVEVEVVDERDRLVEGAQVSVVLPMDGASGTFAANEREYSTTTDARGRAATRGFKPNTVEGRFNIKVTAAFKGREGTAVVAQTNTLAGGVAADRHSRKLVIIGLLAGAGVGGAVIATHGRGSSASVSGLPPPPSISLSVGGIFVAGPR
jgi:hypothetical protein